VGKRKSWPLNEAGLFRVGREGLRWFLGLIPNGKRWDYFGAREKKERRRTAASEVVQFKERGDRSENIARRQKKTQKGGVRIRETDRFRNGETFDEVKGESENGLLEVLLAGKSKRGGKSGLKGKMLKKLGHFRTEKRFAESHNFIEIKVKLPNRTERSHPCQGQNAHDMGLGNRSALFQAERKTGNLTVDKTA